MLRNVALALRLFLHGESHPSLLPWSKLCHSPRAAKKQFPGPFLLQVLSEVVVAIVTASPGLQLCPPACTSVPTCLHTCAHLCTPVQCHRLQRLQQLKAALRGEIFRVYRITDWNRAERNLQFTAWNPGTVTHESRSQWWTVTDSSRWGFLSSRSETAIKRHSFVFVVKWGHWQSPPDKTELSCSLFKDWKR